MVQETYHMAKETYNMAKETYNMAKETYNMAKETYLCVLSTRANRHTFSKVSGIVHLVCAGAIESTFQNVSRPLHSSRRIAQSTLVVKTLVEYTSSKDRVH
jgi:hypothetical protein